MVINEEENIIFTLFSKYESVSMDMLLEAGMTRFRVNVFIEQKILKAKGSSSISLNPSPLFEQYKLFKETGKEVFVMSEDVQKVYDTLIKYDRLSAAFLNTFGLESYRIKKLVTEGVIKKDERDWGFYCLTSTEQFERYSAAASKDPSLTSSTKVKKNLKELYRIYDALIEGKSLTAKTLKSIDLSKENITRLVNDGQLVASESGEYALADYRRFFIYGNYLKERGETDKAQRCYEVCFKLDTSHSVFRPIIEGILLDQYHRTLQKLAFFEGKTDTPYEKDYNFYLYLLSYFIVLPKEQNEYARKLRLSDILIEENEPTNDILNEIKTLAFNKKFAAALKLIAEKYPEEIPGEIAVLRRILTTIEKNQREFKDRVVFCIKNRNIEGLYRQLTCEKRARKLENPFSSMFLIVMDIKEMQESNKPSERTEPQKDTLSEYIKTKNYIRAYIKCISLAVEQGLKDEKNHIGSLLELALETLVKCQESLGEMLEDILDYLQKGSTEVGLKLMRTYLSIHGLSSYTSAISSLIQISILTGDDTYLEPMNTVSQIMNGNARLPILEYAVSAEDSVSNGRPDVAKLYLEIIKDSVTEHHSDTNLNDVNALIEILHSELEPKEKESKDLINRPVEAPTN